ncbi:MAG: hypothetical protein ACRYF0_02700 [Janthinobacterium lividum]
MAETRTVQFTTAPEPWQLAIAKVLKASAEEKGLVTKGPGEWVRVARLATIDIVIDLDTKTFNVSPETKPLLENLVREYLLLGVQ